MKEKQGKTKIQPMLLFITGQTILIKLKANINVLFFLKNNTTHIPAVVSPLEQVSVSSVFVVDSFVVSDLEEGVCIFRSF